MTILDLEKSLQMAYSFLSPDTKVAFIYDNTEFGKSVYDAKTQTLKIFLDDETISQSTEASCDIAREQIESAMSKTEDALREECERLRTELECLQRDYESQKAKAIVFREKSEYLEDVLLKIIDK